MNSDLCGTSLEKAVAAKFGFTLPLWQDGADGWGGESGAHPGCLHRIKMSDCAAESVTSWPFMQIDSELTVKRESGSWEEIKLLFPSGGETKD